MERSDELGDDLFHHQVGGQIFESRCHRLLNTCVDPSQGAQENQEKRSGCYPWMDFSTHAWDIDYNIHDTHFKEKNNIATQVSCCCQIRMTCFHLPKLNPNSVDLWLG